MKKNLATLLVMALVMVLAAPAAASGPKKGGKLIIGRPSDAISLDSNTETTAPGAIVYGNLIEPLLAVDAKGEIKPLLAHKYEIISPDRIRFFLRKGIKFHDGTPFNAEAVKYTYDRAIKQPARWKALFGPLKACEIVDDYTVDITTQVPYGPTLASVAMCYTGILSPAAVEKWGKDYGRHPVGTGPFKFKEWKTKDHITIIRNDDYWGEKAYLDEVVFKVIPEGGARMMAVRTGDIDVAMQPTPSELAVFHKDPNFNVAETMGMRIIYVGFHNQLPPTNDQGIRRALSMAVDVKSILENIMEGSAVMPKSYLAPAVFAFKDMELEKRFPYSPEKAKDLLAKLGWKDSDGDGFLDKGGEKLTLKFLGTKGRYPMDAEICEAVQAMWQAIGVDVKLEFFEWAATFTMLRAPELDYNNYCLGWVTTNRDADYSLYAMFHSSQFSPKGWNRNRYENPEVDKILDKARSSQDREERKALYAKVQDILADAALWVPIYNTKEILVMNKKVKDFVPDPLEYLLPLKPVWIGE